MVDIRSSCIDLIEGIQSITPVVDQSKYRSFFIKSSSFKAYEAASWGVCSLSTYKRETRGFESRPVLELDILTKCRIVFPFFGVSLRYR